MPPKQLRFGSPHWHARLLGRTSVLHRVAGAVALFIAGAACAASGWSAWHANARLSEARMQAASEQARAQRGLRPAPPAMAKPMVIAWNGVVGALNTPWPAILDALEEHTPQDVALVSVEPDPRQGKLRLQAEAKQLEALLRYAEALQDRGPLGSVTLVKHDTYEQDPNKPLRLTFDVSLTGKERAR